MFQKKLWDQSKKQFFHSKVKKPPTSRIDSENSRSKLLNSEWTSKLTYHITYNKHPQRSLPHLMNPLATTILKFKRSRMKPRSSTILRHFSICRNQPTNN
jgi:hypothetical protein